MITDTSLKAYYGDVLPTLGARHELVLKVFINKGNFSNSELANFLQWPINTVTPRVNELRKKGLLRFAGKRKCKVTGKEVMTWEGVSKQFITRADGIPRIYLEGRKQLTNQMTIF